MQKQNLGTHLLAQDQEEEQIEEVEYSDDVDADDVMSGTFGVKQDEEHGPVCSCCGYGCCNIRWCGCTVCVRKDKVMVTALTIIIVLLVFAVVVTELAEVSALSKVGSGTENVVTVTRSMLSLFRLAFSFLGFGTLAMIGAVRTHDPDPEAQRVADLRTGKIIQAGIAVAVVAGIVCSVLAFALYSPFMLHVVNKTSDDVHTGRKYLNYVAPSFAFSFVSVVLQNACLQTGNISMVILDSAIDLIVFSSMVLGWAKEAPADEVVGRLGVCNLLVQLIKFAVYAVFCFRPSFVKQFNLLDFTRSDEMRGFLDKLGADVKWQWVQNVTAALSALVFITCANKIDDVVALSYGAVNIVLILLNLSAAILSTYITFFGSRFLGDQRFAGYWGLYRCTTVWMFILTGLAFVSYDNFRDIAIGAVSDGNNKQDVRDKMTEPGVGFCVVMAVIFNNFATYYRGIFVSLHRFEEYFYIFAASTVVVGVPLASIATAADSFVGLIFGAFMVPQVLQCCMLVFWWHTRVKVQQQKKHRQHLKALSQSIGRPDPQWMKLHEALGWPDIEDAWREVSRGSTSAGVTRGDNSHL